MPRTLLFLPLLLAPAALAQTPQTQQSLAPEDAIRYINDKLELYTPLAYKLSGCRTPQTHLSLDPSRRYLTLAVTTGAGRHCSSETYKINVAFLDSGATETARHCNLGSNGQYADRGEQSWITLCGAEGTVVDLQAPSEPAGRQAALAFAGPEEQGLRLGRAVQLLTAELKQAAEDDLDPNDPFAR